MGKVLKSCCLRQLHKEHGSTCGRHITRVKDLLEQISLTLNTASCIMVIVGLLTSKTGPVAGNFAGQYEAWSKEWVSE
jgi:hypothetical protein